MQVHFLWSLQSICLSEQRNITLQMNYTKYYQAQLFDHYYFRLMRIKLLRSLIY